MSEDRRPIAQAIGEYVIAFSKLQVSLEANVLLLATHEYGDTSPPGRLDEVSLHKKIDPPRILLNGERGPEAGRTLTIARHLWDYVIEHSDGPREALPALVKATEKDVREQIEFRNRLAHGAWVLVADEPDDPVLSGAAELTRTSAGLSSETLEFRTADIARRALRCLRLAGIVNVVSAAVRSRWPDDLVEMVALQDGHIYFTDELDE